MPRKQRTGIVVSDKMDKTVVVRVERTVAHPLYKKVLRRRKKYQAHDETNVCALGDTVLIEECRPVSKHKHWRVLRVIERHEVADLQPRDISAPALDEPAAVPPTSEPAVSPPVAAQPVVIEPASDAPTERAQEAPDALAPASQDTDPLGDADAVAEVAGDAPPPEPQEGGAS